MEEGEESIVWEVRQVNGKGIDIRMRMKKGMEQVENKVR